MTVLKIMKLDPMARVPERNNDTDAGLDLHIIKPVDLAPGKRTVIPTGIAMAIPHGHYGSIRPRSKLAVKYGIDVLAGVVDSSYRGEIMVSLLNTGDRTLELRAGDKVAQMVIEKINRRDYSSLLVNYLYLCRV